MAKERKGRKNCLHVSLIEVYGMSGKKQQQRRLSIEEMEGLKKKLQYRMQRIYLNVAIYYQYIPKLHIKAFLILTSHASLEGIFQQHCQVLFFPFVLSSSKNCRLPGKVVKIQVYRNRLNFIKIRIKTCIQVHIVMLSSLEIKKTYYR